MAKYDFSSLNDKEFEELTRDLLNREYGLRLQSFKRGKDKGIDLRFATTKRPNAIIVQAKHYLATDVKALISKLRREELKKVKSLNPEEYWLVTSLPLSVSDKDKIKEIFGNYIINTNYILGQEDLNMLLTEHKDIEQNWLKLWMTNTSVLKRIINNALIGRSEFHTQKITRDIKLYVENQMFYKGLETLKHHKFILISGQPGVGKTTLADMLTYYLLAHKHQLIYIDKDIEEAGDIFDQDPESKQAIYFDDFLGANHLEILNLRSSESAIVRFIERVQASKNKYLILTTRTTILAEAKENYEKLNRANIDIDKVELNIKDYSLKDKGEILYNHLYHSQASKEQKLELITDKNYWRVIKHKSYTPRLVEFFTSTARLKNIEPGRYLEFITDNLNNPKEIWRYSYTKQLGDSSRLLVTTLFSFGSKFRYGTFHFDNSINLECVRYAFEERLDYEVRSNGFIRPNDAFITALKNLIDGYLVSIWDSGENRVKFINPSIADFLKNYLQESESECWRIIKGALYIEQLRTMFNLYIKNINDENRRQKECKKFIQVVEQEEERFLPTIYLGKNQTLSERNAFHCEIAALFNEVSIYYDDEKAETLTVFHLRQIDWKNLNYTACSELYEIIENSSRNGLVWNFVIDFWQDILLGFFLHFAIHAMDEVLSLFDRYKQDIEIFVGSGDVKQQIATILDEYAEDYSDKMVWDEKDNIYVEEDISTLKQKVKKWRRVFYKKFKLADPGFDEHFIFDGLDMDSIKKERKKKESLKKIKEIREPDNDTFSEKQMELKIDDWFNNMPFH